MNPESIETKVPQKQRHRSALLVPALVVGGGYLLWNAIFAEQSSSLLWLLLLACPLMHFLIPHRHGGARENEQPMEGDANLPSESSGPSSKN